MPTTHPDISTPPNTHRHCSLTGTYSLGSPLKIAPPKSKRLSPLSPLRSAGLKAGERVLAHADGAGRVILEREHDVIAEFAGALTGTYRPDELDDLRSEWD